MKKQEIIEYLKKHKSDFKQKYGVKKIALFGSYAKDSAKESSDIDLLVEMNPEFKKFFSFKRELENAFGKEVDLSFFDSVRLLIKEKIKKELIYV
jgi:predicted nucleotidyltransferase